MIMFAQRGSLREHLSGVIVSLQLGSVRYYLREKTIVGKRSRRDFATWLGLIPVGGGEADPTGSCWPYGEWSSSPIPARQKDSAKSSIPGLCRR
jgi:hypothetical protein